MGLRNLSSRAIIGRFYELLEASKNTGWHRQIGQEFGSDQESETYRFLGMTPKMREWVGGRQAKGLRNNAVTIVNKDFEATLEVTRQERKYDKTGQVDIRINELADSAEAHHWEELLSSVIDGAESSLCYDGQYFFDTDHSEGDSGTQDNDLTYNAGTTTAPTADEMATAILEAIAAIYGFKDDQGRPKNSSVRDFIVMVPNAKFWAPAAQAIAKNMLSTGTGVRDNPLKGMEFNVRPPVLNPRLTWTTKFAVFAVDGRTKPAILQSEEDPVMEAKAEGSEYEFDTGNHQYGVRASRNVGLFDWTKATITTLT